MREIKFRAWDKKKKVMFLVDEIHWFNNATRISGVKGKSDFDNDGYIVNGGLINEYANGERYELMQYTGLKDKNSKEIYEGDIVQSIPGKCEVFWLTDGWSLNKLTVDGRYPDLCQFGTGELEIIGNIYENPELLSTQPSQE